MYYVYVLHSEKNKYVYIGFSNDLKTRYKIHNAGKVKSTRAYCPWKLVYYEAYLVKKDATIRERQLKNHKAKEGLKIQIKHSLI